VGVPADVYTYGAGIWLMCFSLVLVAIATIYIYLPVFYNLELTSTYEYLERRFDRKTRLFATVMYLLASNCYLAVVVYSPALAIATGSRQLVLAQMKQTVYSYWNQCTSCVLHSVRRRHLLYHYWRPRDCSVDRHASVYCNNWFLGVHVRDQFRYSRRFFSCLE
jgi:hypothetical protein